MSAGSSRGSGRGGSADAEQALCPRPQLGSDSGYRPHDHDDPTAPLIPAPLGQTAAGERNGPPRSITAPELRALR